MPFFCQQIVHDRDQDAQSDHFLGYLSAKTFDPPKCHSVALKTDKIRSCRYGIEEEMMMKGCDTTALSSVNISGGTLNDVAGNQNNIVNIFTDESERNMRILQSIIETLKSAITAASLNIDEHFKYKSIDGVPQSRGAPHMRFQPTACDFWNGVPVSERTDKNLPVDMETKRSQLQIYYRVVPIATFVKIEGQRSQPIVSMRYSFDFKEFWTSFQSTPSNLKQNKTENKENKET